MLDKEIGEEKNFFMVGKFYLFFIVYTISIMFSLKSAKL